MKKYFYFLLVSIAVFGLFLRLIDYDRTPPFGETKDEFIYPWAGMSLIQTGTPVSWSPFSSYPTKYWQTYWGQQFPMVSPYIEKPFLYPLLTGSFMLATGATTFEEVRLEVLRLVPIILSAITIVFIGLLARKFETPLRTSFAEVATKAEQGYEGQGEIVGLIAALLFATVPTIVLSNRLSLTENLLVPIVLGILLLFVQNSPIPPLRKRGLGGVGILALGCFLAISTKQIGISLPITLILLLIPQRNWKTISVISVATIIGAAINPLIGFFTDWQFYSNVMSEFSRAHTLGLPETIATLFRVPGIGHKESIFLDGSMLMGFILFFASPFLVGVVRGWGSPIELHLSESTSWWTSLKQNWGKPSNRTPASGPLRQSFSEASRTRDSFKKSETGDIFADRFRGGTMTLWNRLKLHPDRVADQENFSSEPNSNFRLVILTFPFIYITILALIEGGTTWYGWHLFPLYPFLMILLAYSLYHFYKFLDVFQFFPFFLILGASSIRFLLLIHPQFTTLWPQLMLVLGLCIALILFFTTAAKQKMLLMLVFFVYIGINIYTVIHLSQIYPSALQPSM